MNTIYPKPLSKVIFLSDFVVLNTALILTHYLIFVYPALDERTLTFFIFSNVSWLIISLLNKNYRINETVNIEDLVNNFLISVTCQLILVSGIIYFFRILHISRELVLTSFIVFFLMVVTFRLLLITVIKLQPRDASKKLNPYIIGDSEIAQTLISVLKSNNYNFSPSNYISSDQMAKIDRRTLFNNLRRDKVDEIFVCYKNVNIKLIESLIVFGNENGIKIKVIYGKLKNKRSALHYKHSPITHVNKGLLNEKKVKILKRSFDISFALTVMTLGAPVYLILYLITKLTSKGPAIYKQERIGKDEKPFRIYKFRSMHMNAEKFGPQLAKANDPRVTKWGLIMRKTRLDELPQFWNVLRGDMAIVGHRPERRHFIDEISKKTPEYKKLLIAKPGVTSLGQVQYGYAENIDQMCERLNFDLLYARNASLNLDINIILRTVRVMVEGRGK